MNIRKTSLLVLLCLLAPSLVYGQCFTTGAIPSVYDECKPCYVTYDVNEGVIPPLYPGPYCPSTSIPVVHCDTLLGKGLYQASGSYCQGCTNGSLNCTVMSREEGYYFTCGPELDKSALKICALGAGSAVSGCISSLTIPNPWSITACLCGSGVVLVECQTCKLFPCQQVRTGPAYQSYVTQISGTCPTPPPTPGPGHGP